MEAMVRWLAAVGWAVTPAALLLSRYVSIPLRGIEDLATLGIPIVIAVAIGIGGLISRIGAGVGAGLAAIAGSLSVFIVLSGCLGRCGDVAWLGPIAALALSVISLLAARRMPTLMRA